MQFSFFKKKKLEPSHPQKIADAVIAERADLAVSNWLLQKFNSNSVLPIEVEYAYRADRFLQEINGGGFNGFFAWEFDNIDSTLSALRAIGVGNVADDTIQAIKVICGSARFESREVYDELSAELLDDDERTSKLEQLDAKAISQSAEIESKTHVYITNNMAVFSALDQ